MLTRLIAYLNGLIRRGAIHREVDEELEFHLAMETDANIARGLTPDDARRAALIQLGGITQTREAVSDVRSTFLDSLRQDLAYALRTFRRTPAFTCVGLVVLAFGITANTTIFSVVNAVLLRPLPVSEPEDLRFLSVIFTRPFNARLGVPYPTLEQLARRPDVFSNVAGFSSDGARLGTGIGATHVAGERVTTAYFDALGVRAALGRTFVSADDLPGAEPVMVISDRFWRTRLDANPNVLGTTVDLRSPYSSGGTYVRQHRAYTVIGVMPPAFKGISTVWVPVDYWVPMRQRASDLVQASAEISGAVHDDASERGLYQRMRGIVVARPQPGVSDASIRGVVHGAEVEMAETTFATAQGLRSERGAIVEGRSIEGRLPFDPTGTVVPERLAAALMLVPVMVVLIAATNLAGILMARGIARRGEIGVRLALGASRGRVARQMITESLLLSLGGAAAAILLSRALIKLFATFTPPLNGGIFKLGAVSLDVPIDGHVLLFTLALGIGTGVCIGVTPALQAFRTDILGALAGGASAQGTSPRARLRRWIVVPQICFSLVLLLAAGALVRSLLRAELTDRGFNPDGVVYAQVAGPPRYSGGMTPEQRRAENARQKAEYLRLLQAIRTRPGIEFAALTNKVLWTNQDNVPVVTRESLRAGQSRWAAGAHVSDGYFETMRLPVIRGRAFDKTDTASSPPVAILSEDLARLLWPEKDALGEYIASPDPASNAPPTWLRVVGIARAVRIAGTEDRFTPVLYLPIEQRPSLLGATIVARGRVDPAQLLKSLRAAIIAAQPDAEVPRAQMMTEDISEALYPTRLGATVLAASGLFGLMLSAVGLYGVVAYSAAQRRREIGIRTALGAERRDLFALLLRDALVALSMAIALGLAIGLAVVRIVSSLVVALPQLDAPTVVGIPLFLAVLIIAACLQPVRRAARVNPIDVLRAL